MTGVNDRIGKLSDAKRKLLEARLRAAGVAPEPRRFTASVAQRRLWFIDQLLGPSGVYNSAHAIRFRGALDPDILKCALSGVIARQQSLRLSFTTAPDGPIAVVAQPFDLNVPLVDLECLPLEQRQNEELRLAKELGREPFDLSKPPLLRAKLLRASSDEHLLILAIHHIISDRWSVGVLLRELAAHYDAAKSGSAPSLPKLAMSYGEFSRWQTEQIHSAALAPDRQYWGNTLRALPAPLEIPTNHARPAAGSQAGAAHTWTLSPATTRAMESLARANNSTAYMAFAAAFQVLLYRYTGRRDIVVGTPLAGRTRVESEDLIGLFINMLPLRVELDPDRGFLHLLDRTRARSLELLGHQQMPLEQLVEELKVPRELNRSPLFDIVFNFHNVPFEPSAPAGLTVELEEIDLGFSRFDLTMLMRPDAAGAMTCAIEYSTDLFDRATIERMSGHFDTLIAAILTNPNQSIATLPLLTADERTQILDHWSGVHAPPVILSAGEGPATAIHQLFEYHATLNPHALAVVCGTHRLSYADINTRANQLAHYLRSKDITADTPVGVCLARSTNLPISILAVWKSGGAYVPLDPAYPPSRLEAMLEDANPAIILAERATAGAIPARFHQKIILLDDLAPTLASEPHDNPRPVATPENLAYIIFTSGSTGRPKGVAIEHRGILALCHWIGGAFAPEHLRGVLMAASASFDMSVFEVLLALTQGGAAILVDNVLALPDAPAANEVTFMICAPTAMSELLRAGRLPASLKAIALGAEYVPASLVGACYELPNVQRVYNLYGPSEDSIVSTGCIVPRDQEGPPPIGTPVPGSVAYILDDHRQPVPVGVTGELYIAGAKLARGYANRPDLTADRFVPHPLSPNSGGADILVCPESESAGCTHPAERTRRSRAYRTGDLCKWNPDGSIQYVARADRQVKLRGFRIELEDVESALESIEGVRQSVAALRGAGDSQRLIAYVVADPSFDTAAARQELSKRLPGYMIPSAIVRLDSLPITPNGKIDRAALPDSPDSAFRTPHSALLPVPPRDELERRLIEIWKDLLNTDSIGVHDSFFDLGGHSLLAVRLVQRIADSLKQSLPLAKLFTAPTIAQLADLLRQGGIALHDDVLVPLRAKGDLPPLFCVPGIFNDAFTFEPLTRRLDPRQPIYALLLQGLATRGGVPTTVEAMARAFIDQIRQVQPHGPYRLGGYSFGGLVAHEMAVQLSDAGEQVELLVQFDSFSPAAARQRPLYQRLALHLLRLFKRSDGKWAGFTPVTSALQALGINASGSPPPNLSPLETTVRSACEQARRSHQSRPLSGKVLLFRATVREEWRAFLVHAPDNGWTELAKAGLEIRDVDGGHLNLLQDQHVDRLAKELNDSLHALPDAGYKKACDPSCTSAQANPLAI